MNNNTLPHMMLQTNRSLKSSICRLKYNLAKGPRVYSVASSLPLQWETVS